MLVLFIIIGISLIIVGIIAITVKIVNHTTIKKLNSDYFDNTVVENKGGLKLKDLRNFIIETRKLSGNMSIIITYLESHDRNAIAISTDEENNQINIYNF